jgi:hypothetical protein
MCHDTVFSLIPIPIDMRYPDPYTVRDNCSKKS